MNTPRMLAAILGGLLAASALQAQGAPAPSQWAGLTLAVEPQSARVLTAREGTVLPARNVALHGGTVRYRFPDSPFSAALQIAQSTRSGDLAYGLAGGSAALAGFSAEAGYGWRRGYDQSTGLVHGRMHHFARIGGGWGADVAATPLSLGARVGFFMPIGALAESESSVTGWEGETSITAALSGMPLSLGLAYRFERFRVLRTEQEVSSIRLSLTWRAGARTR